MRDEHAPFNSFVGLGSVTSMALASRNKDCHRHLLGISRTPVFERKVGAATRLINPTSLKGSPDSQEMLAHPKTKEDVQARRRLDADDGTRAEPFAEAVTNWRAEYHGPRQGCHRQGLGIRRGAD